MRVAVLGSPIAHSLSPVLHSAAYRTLGLADWSYERHECDEAGLPAFLAALDDQWAGLSLTMPLKRIALSLASQRSAVADAVGAANTLVRVPTGWRAENTDVHGIAAALRGAGVSSVEQAVVLGAGGTAQAALAALRELGERRPTVLVRDAGRTVELRRAADRLGVAPTIHDGRLHEPLPPADVVISTLPVGAADAIRLSDSDPPTVVLDVVYSPWPTRLAATAQRGGVLVVSGLEMLLHQAAAQVELITGRPAPVAEMRAALEQAVADRSR